MIIHATCIAFNRRAILLLGPSGSGKSSMALAAVQQGAMLVADDQVRLDIVHNKLLASPPALAGHVEIRGQGLVILPYLRYAPVHLAVQMTEPAAIERWPAHDTYKVTGCQLPLYYLWPFDANAPQKLQLLLATTLLTS